MTTETQHSIYSASAAHRWLIDPGSIALIENAQNIDNESSVYAEEGTMLHAVTEHYLEHGGTPTSEPATFEYDDHGVTKTVNTKELTDEQIEAVEYCLALDASIECDAAYPEQRVYYGKTIGVKPEEAFGTLDRGKLQRKHLYIIDWKFGRMFVDPNDNPQLTLYALGMLEILDAFGDEVEKVTIVIAQPRVQHGDISLEDISETITVEELRARGDQYRKRAAICEEARATYDINSKEWRQKYLQPSADACRWCPVRAFCPALAEATKLPLAQAATIDEFGVEESQVFDSNEVLAEAQGQVELMEIWIKAVKETTLSRMAKGQTVPGWKLVQGRAGNRKWKDEEEAEKFLRKQGVPDPMVHKLATPTQAEALLAKVIGGETKKAAKEAAGNLLENKVTRTPPKPTVVPEGASGKPWTSGASADEFD